MDERERAAILADVVSHAEDVFSGVERRWGEFTRLDPLPVTPLSERDSGFPESADAFLGEFYPYAAGTVVIDDENRLLCVYSPARDEWETPGGAGEAGESPAETARRETLEETGIECEITGVLHARTMELDLGAPESLPIPVAVFTASPVGGDELAGDEIDDHVEITDLAWFDAAELPTEMREYDQKYDYLRSLGENSDGA